MNNLYFDYIYLIKDMRGLHFMKEKVLKSKKEKMIKVIYSNTGEKTIKETINNLITSHSKTKHE